MQTDCRPQKRGRGLVGPCSDPLVGPRDPACRDALGAAPHSSCSCDRLVGLATSPSGRRTRSPHQKQTATVMLGRVLINRVWCSPNVGYPRNRPSAVLEPHVAMWMNAD